MFWKTKTALITTAAALSVLSGTSCSMASPTQFAIPSEDLGQALKDFARTTNVQVIVASDLVAGKTSGGANGKLVPELALAEILAGSGLHANLVAGAYVIQQGPQAQLASAAPPGRNDIVVTGTRIHGGAPIGAPLTVIDRTAIENSGYATVSDYLKTLPQNFNGADSEENYGIDPHGGDNIGFSSSINLRGLGAESTLTLFDGNRPAVGGTVGAFVDTSLIPSTAIDRIEILTDGASALYGTDAVAGVVNVRFRHRYDGFETHLYSGTAGGAFTQLQASQLFGKSWHSGGIVVAYQYDHRGRLAGSDRRFATEDLTPWGGPDLREPYSVPGTLVAANGETFAIPADQDGRNLSASDLLAGTENLTDRRKLMDILPRTTTHSVYGSVDQDIGTSLSAYARVLFARRAFDAHLNPDILSPFTVPVSNPFYVDPTGSGQPVSVDYDFSRDLGAFTEKGVISAVTTSAGLKATLGSWTFEASGNFGHQIEHIDSLNGVSGLRVAEALADTDPATALNLFGDGTGNAPQTLAFIRASKRYFDRSTVWSTAFRADGSLFELPAGTVKLAAGYEHRDEKFAAGYYYDQYEAEPGDFDLYRTPGTPGHRNVDAVYGELSIPVFNAGQSLPGRLDASLSGRVDWYSDVGRTANPKAGLSWTPTNGVKLRGSWGTSFRAPTFFENGGSASNSYQPYYATDPSSPTGTTATVVILGYADKMKPEKATSWTAGFDIEPTAIAGLKASATYFNIAYRDRIANPITYLPNILVQPDLYAPLIEAATPDRVAALYASPLFYNYYGIPASAIRYILHLETQNLSRQTVRGIDFSLNYSHALGSGTGSIGVNGTRMLAIDQKITATSPAQDVAGLMYNPVRWRLRGHAGWTRGGFSGDVFANYTGGYLNNQVAPAEHVKSWTTIDLQIGYHFPSASPLKGARIALSATNLFDRDPPYVFNSVYGQTTAYDPGQASAIGRLLSVEMTYQW
ncbi:TonB-dependent receptor [Sphingomonas oryzagri]